MHPCPSCSRAFETRRGLGVHHSIVHDEQLPNRSCDECGTRFYSSYEKRYCSDECLDRAVSFEGSDNPNFDGGPETTSCEICGESFEYYPSDKEGLYCPDCVKTESWRNIPHLSGEDHPRWSGGVEELTCDHCDRPFERSQQAITSDHVFCTSECQYRWASEQFTGSGHPNWKGGGNADYGPGWRRARELALRRDRYTCVICGCDSEDLGRNPDVHHIVPVRAFVENEATTIRDAHYLENLVSLCIGCHRRAEFGHISSTRLQWLVEGR